MHLNAAAAVLSKIDLRKRQFDASQRRSLSVSKIGLISYTVIFGLVLAVFGTVPLVALSATDSSGLAMPMMFGSPFVILLAVGGLGLLVAVARMRRFERVCSAVPPPGPGEPALCRVCDAPVAPPSSLQPFARCGYCQADNLVSPAALDRARRRQSLQLGDYESVTGSRAVMSFGISAASTVTLVLASVVVPVIVFVGTLTLMVGAITCGSDDGGKADASSYAAPQHKGRTCVGDAVRKHDGTWEVRVAAAKTGPRDRVTLPASPPSKVFDARWLVGKRVLVSRGPGDELGTVRSVYRSKWVGTNGAEVALDGGGTTRVPVTSLCLPPSASP